MKNLFCLALILVSQAALANDLNLECKNTDGTIRLESTKPCGRCAVDTPAFSFIGGEGILSDGIPAYESDMPGYIDFDGKASKAVNQDVLSLIDGGTWWISVYLPKGFLNSNHAKGETFQATMDSSYSDIMESELNDVALDCTVQ